MGRLATTLGSTTSMSPTSQPIDRAEITSALKELLASDPGQNASELGRKLGLHKSDLNPILYGSPEFAKSADTKPRWFLASDAVDLGEQVPVRTERERKPMPSENGVPIDLDALIVGEEVPDEELSEEALARFIKTNPEPRLPYVAPSVTADNPLGLYAWQQEALARWELFGSQGIIDAVTGAGKTRLAVAAIAKHFAAGGKTLVVVPTIVLLHQWADVLAQNIPGCTVGLVGDGRDDDLRDVDVVVSVIASARTRKFKLNGAKGLIVVDECHRSASEQNQKALDDDFEKRLGLSATHERMDNAHETILLPYFKRIVFSLDYERAIKDGVITNVRVAFVGVNFSEEEMAEYQKYVRDLNTLRRKLVREFGVRSAPFSVFLDDVLRLTRGGPGSMHGGIAANRWLTSWRKKRELLAETPAKQLAIAQMTAAMRDSERTLLFTQSIKSANEIAQILNDRGVVTEPHHSEIDSDVREEIMARFSDGELKALASVQTLEEGVDVPDADLAIIVASSKQRRQMIQRMGRVMRRKGDGRDARFIILYVNNTDEDPRRGAHDVFVEELLNVARESNIFDLKEGQELLRDFLDPQRT